MERHRYYFDLVLAGTDRQNLADALEDEYLPLTAHVPIWELCERVREGRFHFEHESEKPIEGFERNFEAFSAYLHQVVKAFHAVEEAAGEERRLTGARKILAVRGEVLSVPLVLPPSRLLQDLDPDADDLDHIERYWRGFPRWFQDGMRRKHPSLRRL
ncbi:MAG: hypothetical protein A3J27_14405 [Candidatus Tectomicrobia bacterium RIFCSPLOWO2_12_FULL_69_37]|nr:MAG: hypothetical protein A3I72_14220 [Candidatus Tectomicrobia bacterium RIFCSPLOWO2_02_FULL_70_19]OGL62754.1 MAG: hypothetical protein A3J27_14405 [Candidatus Tectomicrobia bacterium RIFCSPLOWO2_12_FULL_69_37]